MAHTIRANSPETHTGALTRFRSRTTDAVEALAENVRYAATIVARDPETEAKIQAALYPAED